MQEILEWLMEGTGLGSLSLFKGLCWIKVKEANSGGANSQKRDVV